RGERRDHGRARRPCGRGRLRVDDRPSEGADPARALAEQGLDHRDPEARVDDQPCIADPGGGLRRRERGDGRHGCGDAVGGDGDRPLSGTGCRDDGGAVHRRREARDVPPRGELPPRGRVQARRRGDRDGGDVRRESSEGQGHHRVDGVWLDDAMDVAGSFGHSDLRVHPSRDDEAASHAVPRRLSGLVRRHGDQRLGHPRTSLRQSPLERCTRAGRSRHIHSRRAAGRFRRYEYDADLDRALSVKEAAETSSSDVAALLRPGRPVRGGHRKALVLPGAGARGAYQVGVLKAIAHILPKPSENPFSIIAGTSAGAINAAVLASRAGHFEQAVSEMERVWANFAANHVYRTDNWTMLKASLHWLAALVFGGLGVGNPKSLLDNAPLRELLMRRIPRGAITRSIERGYVDALAITASAYTSARSVTFYQTKLQVEPWERVRRVGLPAKISVDHLLASAAVPFVFPPVRLGGEYFGDGSM